MEGGSEESTPVVLTIKDIKKEKEEDEEPEKVEVDVEAKDKMEVDVEDKDKMEVDQGGGGGDGGDLSGSTTEGEEDDEEEDGGDINGGADYVFIQNIKQEIPSSSEEEVSPKKKDGGGGGSSTDTAPSSPEKKVIRMNAPVCNLFKTPQAPPKDGGSGGGGGGGGASSNSEFLKASLALAAALKSEPKKKVFCANTNCNCKTDSVFEINNYGKIYFGMKVGGGGGGGGGGVKVCGGCLKKAEGYEKEAKGKIRNKENLFDVKTEIQTAESDAMIDLDSPVGSPVPPEDGDVDGADGGSEELYQVDLNKINDFVSGRLGDWKVKEQVDKCVDKVGKDADELAEQFSTLDLQLEKLRSTIEDATKLYNDNVAVKSKTVEIGALHIGERGYMRAEPNRNLNQASLEINRISGNALKKVVGELSALNNKPIPEHERPRGMGQGRGYPPMMPNLTRIHPSTDPNFRMRRKPHQLIFVQPKLHQEVYAMHKHILCYFLPAIIVKITSPLGPHRPAIYTVQFQQKVKPRSRSGCDDAECYQKDLTGKQIAFKKSSTLVLPVGTRALARFKDLLNLDGDVDGYLYAGIVAEVPRDVNRQRYLIFFDDGYAQYCKPNEVFPVCESSADVWNDVHKNTQEFVQDYVATFPHRHMIRAGIGSTFTVELNGEWIIAKIADVDSSLLKMQYMQRKDGGPAFEWIYRGSTRLGPLFNRLKSLKAKPPPTVARRHTYSSRRSNYSFELNWDNGRENSGAMPCAEGREELRRVQGVGPNAGAMLPVGPVKGGVIRARDGKVINTKLESEGNMIKIQVPRDCPVPKKWVPHECSEECGLKYEEESFRKVSPLAVPFYLGWAREIIGVARDKVCYHSPCGLSLGSYEEVHNWIVKTEVGIPIDYFSMEPGIDCLNEFEPLRRIEYLKDISYGKEWTPVTCVNSLDHDLPAYMEYITQRIQGKGVKISEDDGFLTCCDCEDDCSDKEKCACWQMTLKGISFRIARQEGMQLEGFENRRLKNHVLSGIYECNRKCKCRQSTCFNRVVQNKVKWPIQMFKTVAKGWGVRALHDMPRGSFICVYTGQLLTDAGANESGIEAGDEYLAELDFIECNEQIKEDYEEDCTDIEMEEPGTRTRERQAHKMNGASSEQVAKKVTIQKAVKSTGGGTGGTGRIKSYKDPASPADSQTSTGSGSGYAKKSTSSTSIGQATARKSGSRNGKGLASPSATTHPSPTSSTASTEPSPCSSSASSSTSGGGGGSIASRTRRSASKDFEDGGDEEDDDDIQVYSSFNPSLSCGGGRNAPRLPLREYFGKEEAVYIMDAKSMGNFGRYLNHSCDPNVFVQNLFVDTHDPRFPWVAFFTKKDVKAGTELTWDYNYDIGSVPGKTLYCYCYADNCRRRLL